MARAWGRAVLAAFAAAMLGACALDTSQRQDPVADQRAVDAGAASSDNWFSRLFRRSSGDSAPNWFSRLFGRSSGDSAPPPAPKAAAVTSESGTSTPQKLPRPPPVTGRYLVQLAAARTEAEAEALATKAKRTHPAELGAQAQSIDQAVLGNMGTFYLVRFGPFASAQETRTVCAKLRDSGIDCLPINR